MENTEYVPDTGLEGQTKIYNYIEQKYSEFELWFHNLKTKQRIIKLMTIHIFVAVLTVSAWVLTDSFIWELHPTQLTVIAFPTLIVSYMMFFYRYFILQQIKPMSKYLLCKHLLGYGGILIKEPDQSQCHLMAIIDDNFEVLKVREQDYIETQSKQVRADMIINLTLYYVVLADVLYYVIKYASSIQVILPK